MIAEDIYIGMTAEQIGLSEKDYVRRKKIVDRFVAQWDGVDFKKSYSRWISTQEEGGAGGENVPKIDIDLDLHMKNEGSFVLTSADMPSAGTRAGNFARAMFRFVVEGMPIESRADAEARLSICESNECGFFDGSVCRHTKCGCFSKIKTFLTTEHCPLGKW
jgi:hypothetical protein